MNVWDLEGLCIEAWYLVGVAKVRGLVTHSRVKYGGTVSHHVTLVAGFSACGGKIKRNAGDVVLIEHRDVLCVYSKEA